ncbi:MULTISPECIES: YSIRK-type signal peptide-containing protein [unclassified Streptococcus]|nr:YSIRK-type signal peptide-containing protein [Streptococcus sp. HMSC078D09]
MGKRLVDQRNRFGIRKLSVGVCSVVVATCFFRSYYQLRRGTS